MELAKVPSDVRPPLVHGIAYTIGIYMTSHEDQVISMRQGGWTVSRAAIRTHSRNAIASNPGLLLKTPRFEANAVLVV